MGANFIKLFMKMARRSRTPAGVTQIPSPFLVRHHGPAVTNCRARHTGSAKVFAFRFRSAVARASQFVAFHAYGPTDRPMLTGAR